jgi:hypothetical protein
MAAILPTINAKKSADWWSCSSNLLTARRYVILYSPVESNRLPIRDWILILCYTLDQLFISHKTLTNYYL